MFKKRLGKFEVLVGGDTAGRLTLFKRPKQKGYNGLGVHFFVVKDYRQWGYVEDWCDGPLCSFGLGWFFMIAW